MSVELDHRLGGHLLNSNDFVMGRVDVVEPYPPIVAEPLSHFLINDPHGPALLTLVTLEEHNHIVR